MQVVEKFSDLSVEEVQILIDAITLWSNFDRLLEPSTLKVLLSGIENEKDCKDLEEKIKNETTRIINLKHQDTTRLRNSLDILLGKKINEEINELIGEHHE